MTVAYIKSKTPLIIVSAAAVSFGICLFTQGVSGKAGAYDGLMLCGEVIIPSLFPFMVIAAFITRSGAAEILSRPLAPAARIFGLPPAAGFALFISFVGGYPIGASMAAQLHRDGVLSEKEAARMMCFAVCGGPAFIIKAVGEGMLGSARAGGLLLFAHISGAVILGVTMGIFSKKERRSAKPTAPSAATSITDAFVGSVYSSCLSMFSVCGFVIIFSSLLAVISSFGLPPAFETALGCLLEVTTGCRGAARLGSLPLIAAVLGFGGISVCFQAFSAADGVKVSIPRFLFFRIMHALLSALFAILLVRLFPSAVTAFLSSDTPLSALPFAHAAPASLALVLMSVAFLCSVNGGKSARGGNGK